MASTAARGSLSRRKPEGEKERMIHRSYQAGEVIWRTHGPLRLRGTVESGEIDVETWVGGALTRTTRLRAGESLPARALWNRRPNETSIARAITEARLGILPELHAAREQTTGKTYRWMNWLWPVLLLLLVIVLARDDIARISSGLFYMASTQGASLQDPSSTGLLNAAQKVDQGAAFTYNEQGYRWFLDNNLPDASTAFNDALARDPANAPALNNLAVTYFTQGDLDRAAGTLQQAMAYDPDNPIPRYNLGITLMQLDSLNPAISMFREAGFIDPEAAPPVLQQAYLYQQMGDYANAEQRARSAIQLNPSLTPAHLLLGMALYQQGREADALDSFNEALVLEPGNRVASFYQALILGHQRQYDAALPVLHELLISSMDPSEMARILAEIDALYYFQAESTADGP